MDMIEMKMGFIWAYLRRRGYRFGFEMYIVALVNHGNTRRMASYSLPEGTGSFLAESHVEIYIVLQLFWLLDVLMRMNEGACVRHGVGWSE